MPLGLPPDVSSSSSVVCQSVKNWHEKVRLFCATPFLPRSCEHTTALRLACDKLPTSMEFIDRKALPRLGNLLIAPEMPADVDLSKTVEPTP